MPVTAFNSADHLGNNLLFRKRSFHLNPARQIKGAVLHRAQNICHDSFDVTVRRNIGVRLSDDVHHVTLIGPDVKEWFFHGGHVVDFAWVDNPYILIPITTTLRSAADRDPDSFSIGW